MTRGVVRRPNLPITEKDEADLDLIRNSPACRRALDSLVPNSSGQGGSVSEAGLLHAIFEAGISAVIRCAEEEGYAELAAQRSSDEQRRIARRRKPSWADES